MNIPGRKDMKKDFKAFYEKRGIKVKRVDEGLGGYALLVDKPIRALEIWSEVSDDASLVLIQWVPWWKKLMFWVK